MFWSAAASSKIQELPPVRHMQQQQVSWDFVPSSLQVDLIEPGLWCEPWNLEYVEDLPTELCHFWAKCGEIFQHHGASGDFSRDFCLEDRFHAWKVTSLEKFIDGSYTVYIGRAQCGHASVICEAAGRPVVRKGWTWVEQRGSKVKAIPRNSSYSSGCPILNRRSKMIQWIDWRRVVYSLKPSLQNW